MPDDTRYVKFNAFDPLSKNVIEYIDGADVTGDGLVDLVLGLPNAKVNEEDEESGVIAIITGQKNQPNLIEISDLFNHNVITIPVHNSNLDWHSQVSISGTKIAIGYPQAESPFVPGAQTGAVKIIDLDGFVAPMVFPSVDSILYGEIYGRKDGDQLGISLDYLGDVNNDGISEIFIGALDTDESEPINGYVLTPQESVAVENWSMW
jgi:hypothetical protein